MSGFRTPLIAGALLAGFAFSGATAHPGPKILTQFGGAERSDSSGGVQVTRIAGVHLYEGPRRLDDALEGAASASVDNAVAIVIELRYRPRRIRDLRTQGFYSGTAPQSRRFTQGFYSGG